MKKFLALALVLILSVSMLAVTAMAAEAETIKVSFWDASTTKRMTKLVEGFNKLYPEITVEVIDIPSADYNMKLNVMLNGGSELDVYFVKDASMFPTLAAKGQMENLTPYVEQDKVDLSIYSGIADNFLYEGKLVAMPVSSSYYILYYNKDIFDAAGIAYPTNDMTWTEFEALAAKLTSGEGVEKNYGALFHTWQACVENWAVADGSMTIMSDDLTGFKPYYDMVIRMQEAGTCMDYATLKTGSLHYSSLFMQGHQAMMPMGGWYCSTLLQKKVTGEHNVNWGIATLPHAEGVEAGNTVGSVTPAAINPASTKKDAAWKFVKYVSSEEGAKIHTSIGEFPAYLSPETLAEFAALDGMPEGALEALQVKNVYLDRPLVPLADEVNQMLGEQHSLIMLGEVSVDDGIAEMMKLSKEIRSAQ